MQLWLDLKGVTFAVLIPKKLFQALLLVKAGFVFELVLES